jgi:hypothetical protein
MKLTGVKLDNPVWESSRRVAEAIVTPERIAMDWIENGVRYHLLARSQDGGLTYRGNYGMFRPEEDWAIEITRYTAVNGSVVLWCDWHEKDSGRAGSWICRLESNPM